MEQRRPRLLKAMEIRRHALIRLHREQIALLREWREALREERARRCRAPADRSAGDGERDRRRAEDDGGKGLG